MPIKRFYIIDEIVQLLYTIEAIWSKHCLYVQVEDALAFAVDS